MKDTHTPHTPPNQAPYTQSFKESKNSFVVEFDGVFGGAAIWVSSVAWGDGIHDAMHHVLRTWKVH